MKPISLAKYLHLTTLSKPASDRVVYKAIKKHRIRSILEIGLGSGERALNMIRLAQKFSEAGNIRYTGVDLFEDRPEGSDELSLINVHRNLNSVDAKTQLVPGEPHQAIPRIANSHLRTDLILISAGYDPQSLERSWFYMPRMIHANSVVLVQDAIGFNRPYKSLNRLNIEQLADQHGITRPMAA